MASGRRSRPAPDDHLANVFGAVALDATTRTVGAVESATGVSMVQATALSALANYADGQSIDMLRSAVGLTHSAAVRLVDRLAELGLVERRTSVDDARVAAVHLTSAGRRTVRKIRRARGVALGEWVERLTRTERAELGRLLDKAAGRGVVTEPGSMNDADFVCRLCDPSACGHPDHCPVTEAVHPTR